MSNGENVGPVSNDTYIEIQRFMFEEAAVLDRRDYQRWLGLLTDDINYRVCAQVHRDATARPVEYAIIDEDAGRLKARVDQITNPRLTHAENPRTLIRRFVSNFQVDHGAAPTEYLVISNLLIYRTRPDLPDGGLYAGERSDTLRRLGSELRLARRSVRLDQSILRGTVSTIF